MSEGAISDIIIIAECKRFGLMIKNPLLQFTVFIQVNAPT